MKPLAFPSAALFTQGFTPQPGLPTFDVHAYLTNAGTRQFTEGNQSFDELRFCLLSESEQSLHMAINCYARALEGLRSGSSYWSAVSFYYACFFASKTVMGVHGCWMNRPNYYIEVFNSRAGAIVLNLRTSEYGVKGSHKAHWQAFYSMTASLAGFLQSGNARLARSPINNNKMWLIETRNDLNYRPQDALKLTREFVADFNPADIPNCFRGKLQTLYKVSRAFVYFAKETADRVQLNTGVWQPEPNRAQFVMDHMLTAQHPSLNDFYRSEVPNALV